MANAKTHENQHSKALRKAGLRPVLLWVPDLRNPDFAEECRRQSRLAALADMADTDLQRLIEEPPVEIKGWRARTPDVK